MNQSQTILVLMIIGGGLVTIGAAWWLSQREAGGPSITAAPFRAQPGTEREQRIEFDAPAAQSSVDPDAAEEPDDAPPLEDDPPPAAEAPELGVEEELPSIAQRALANPNPVAGLESLLPALAAASAAEASGLYAAAGTLYLSQYPPNESASIAAFEQAIETAVEPHQAQRAAVQLAEVLMSRGEQIEALEVLARVMPVETEAPVPSRAAVRLRLFQGGLFEDAGDERKARACFEEALANARILYLAIGDTDTAAVYRQASLALARHHRNRGDHEAADTVVARMRATIGES